MRNYINVTIVTKKQNLTTQLQHGMHLKDALVNAGVKHPAYCGGRGTCGKCIIKFHSEPTNPSFEDINFIEAKDILAGFRLACKSVPKDDVIIEVVSDGGEEIHNDSETQKGIQNIEIEDREEIEKTLKKIERSILKKESKFSELLEKATKSKPEQSRVTKQQKMKEKNKYAIAIDLGTTSIVFKMVNISIRSEVTTYTILNSGRVIGADVVSRIAAANNGKLCQLQCMVKSDLAQGIEYLISKTRVPYDSISKIIVSANTVMVHLLMGYNCEGLGKSPFKAYSLNMISTKCSKIIDVDYDIDMVVLPGISAYIGGDLLAGCSYMNIAQTSDISLFIDIGTNTEMALGNKGVIVCTSASAGPALEGGHIECGIGSVQGAISKVEIDEMHVPRYSTIGGKKPVGICGSGVIDTIAEGIKRGIINEHGLYADNYFEVGIVFNREGRDKPIYLSQSDIREIQLAKSAIRSGIEVLMYECDISYKDIKNTYISGAFGSNINIYNAMRIGMLPKELEHTYRILGNTSLEGATAFAMEPGFPIRMLYTLSISTSINLAKNDKFNEYFIKYLNF